MSAFMETKPSPVAKLNKPINLVFESSLNRHNRFLQAILLISLYCLQANIKNSLNENKKIYLHLSTPFLSTAMKYQTFLNLVNGNSLRNDRISPYFLWSYLFF